jgi:hypothetical protein
MTIGGSVVGAAGWVVVVAGAVVGAVVVAAVVGGGLVVDAGWSSEVQAVAINSKTIARMGQRFTTTSAV